MIKQLIVSSSIIGSLLISVPAWSSLSTFNIGTQHSITKEGNNQGVIHAGLANVIHQKKSNIIFTDLRLSTNDHHVRGLHLGIGSRIIFDNFMIGLHSSYDLYNNKTRTRQYVGGFEISHDIFKFRWNFYYPHSSHKKVYVGMKGFSEELEMKIAQTHDVSLLLKRYKFSDIMDDHIDGYGANIKYTSKFHSRFNFYISAGYQSDNANEHQLSIDSGMKIAIGNRQNLARNYYEAVVPFTRNMFVHGQNANTSNAVIYTEDQDLHSIINNAAENTTVMLRDNAAVENTIQLKKGQNLYGNAKKYSKIHAKSDLKGPLLKLSDDVEIKNIEFDGANLKSASPVTNQENSGNIAHNTTNQSDNIQKQGKQKVVVQKEQKQKQKQPLKKKIERPSKKVKERELVEPILVNQSQKTDAIIFAGTQVKNVNFINNRIYGHAQDDLHGILLNNGGTNIKINNNIIKNNKKISAIQAGDTLKNSEISGNEIEGKGNKAFGISLATSDNNTINNNNVKVQGFSANGIYIYAVQEKNKIAYNKINAIGHANAQAIYLRQPSQNVTIQNNQLDSNAIFHGNSIYFFGEGNKNSIIENKISTKGSKSDEIYFKKEATSNTIKNNNISITGNVVNAINFTENATSNTIENNNISITAKFVDAINFTENATSNTIENNNISITARSVDAINFTENATSNTIENNNISINGTSINVIIFEAEGSQNKITNNTLYTHGYSSDVIYFKSISTGNQILNNKIDAKCTNAYGMIFNDQATNTIISDNTLNTSNQSIRFQKNTQETTIENNTITVTKKDKNAIEFSSTSELIKQDDIKKNNKITTNGGAEVVVTKSN